MQERDEVIMAKKLDFDKEKNNRNDNAIEEIMQADFPLPKQAEDLPESEKWQQLLEMRKTQRIWCEDYRRNQQRNQQKNQQEVPGKNHPEQ